MNIENIKVGETYMLDGVARVVVLELQATRSQYVVGKGGLKPETIKGIKVQHVERDGTPYRMTDRGRVFTVKPEIITNHRRLTRVKR